MTCLEVQSNIMAFVEGKLSDGNAREFVRHIRHCKNCSEELEIYYTLIVGIKQIDASQELSENFKEDLNRELSKIEHKERSAKRFKFSTFGVAFCFAVVGLMFLYNRCLNKVYNIEQILKFEQQGENYFYKNYCDFISLCEDDIVEYNKVLVQPRETTFYEKIQLYNLKNPNREEVENE